MTETSNPNPDKNQHITEYLEYYINQEEPADSAILLTGSWGCGKTYYIDQFIDKIKSKDGQQKYIFKISLFGLKTTADLDDQIGQEICYSLEVGLGHGARVIGKALTAAGTVWNLLDTPIKIKQDKLQKSSENLSKKLEKFLFDKNKNNITFVFDDLERTDIPLKELLGHINAFVERDHLKVILIANEDELTKEFIQQEQTEEKEISEAKAYISEDDLKNRETYKKFKEKVIGKTFEVQSDLNKVLFYFIDQHPYNDLISPYHNIIEFIYTNHRIKNLRQLKQSLDDFRYLLDHLDENHRQSSNFLKDLISNFFDLKLAILKHHSLPDDFNQPTNLIYPQEVWERILFKSDYSEIKEITNQLSYFIPEDEQPLWMKLYDFQTLDDHIFDTLSKQLIHNFNTLKEEDYYEYFHTIGLIIFWSELKIISETTEQIEQIAQLYLKEYSSRWFEKYYFKWRNIRFNSSINLNGNNKTKHGYISSSNPTFIKIWNLFHQKQKEIIDKIKQIELGVDILIYMKQDDITSLKEFLWLDNDNKPVFNQINPTDFLKEMYKLTNKQLYNFSYVIYSRYLDKTHSIADYMTLELYFWKQIDIKLADYLKENQNLGAIKQFQLNRLLECTQNIIQNINNHKYMFITNLLKSRELNKLEEYLCDDNQYGQLTIFDEQGDIVNFKHDLPFYTEEELVYLNKTLIKRYNNLKNINIIKEELAFWQNIIQDLQKNKNEIDEDEESYTAVTSIIENIIKKLKEKIGQQE